MKEGSSPPPAPPPQTHTQSEEMMLLLTAVPPQWRARPLYLSLPPFLPHSIHLSTPLSQIASVEVRDGRMRRVRVCK